MVGTSEGVSSGIIAMQGREIVRAEFVVEGAREECMVVGKSPVRTSIDSVEVGTRRAFSGGGETKSFFFFGE